MYVCSAAVGEPAKVEEDPIEETTGAYLVAAECGETTHIHVPLECAPDGPADHAFIMSMVANAYSVPQAALAAPSRCEARVSEARQVAMYLAHVSWGRTFTDIGQDSGRDRTTAAYACQRVEDLRDELLFDTALDYLDAVLRVRSDVLAGAAASNSAADRRR